MYESNMNEIDPIKFIIIEILVSPWLFNKILFESDPIPTYKEGTINIDKNNEACGYFTPNNVRIMVSETDIMKMMMGTKNIVEYRIDPKYISFRLSYSFNILNLENAGKKFNLSDANNTPTTVLNQEATPKLPINSAETYHDNRNPRNCVANPMIRVPMNNGNPKVSNSFKTWNWDFSEIISVLFNESDVTRKNPTIATTIRLEIYPNIGPKTPNP
jgi:hypothetical protein